LIRQVYLRLEDNYGINLSHTEPYTDLSSSRG
jgi:hypothetical protein